jgi:putative flippase GtrA
MRHLTIVRPTLPHFTPELEQQSATRSQPASTRGGSATTDTRQTRATPPFAAAAWSTPGASLTIAGVKIIRYFFVGGVAACVDIGFFLLFAKILGFNYLLVASIGFILATLVNYVLSVRYVFDSGVRFSRKREFALIYAVSALGLLFNLAALYLLVDIARAELMLSKIIATATVFFWNYLARKHYVFRPASG